MLQVLENAKKDIKKREVVFFFEVGKAFAHV